MTGLDANLEKSVELMRRHFREPRIEPGALDRLIQVQLGAHKDNKLNPETVLEALAEYARYGKDSETLNELSDAEVKALKEDKLAALMRDVLSHARRVSYVGSRSAGEMTRLLDDGFSAYSPIPARQPKRLLRPSADRVLFLDRDMVQSKFGLFAVDGEYDPSRAVGAQFYGSYMGGMDGVVFQQVREARSLAYYAYGGYRQAELRGEDSRASGYVECQADKTAEATALLKQLMSAMPVETKRFDEVKAGIEGLYRSDRVNFRAVPGKVMAWEDLGFAADPRPARFKTALLYTMPELTAFAQRFSKGPWTLFMMGSRPRVDMGALKRLGVLEDRAADQLFPY
jgi:predicted Zn-dependent peptidase